jgi:hypothetical protein
MEPESEFTIAIPADSPDRAVLTLARPRNISYTFKFSMNVEAAPPEGYSGSLPYTKLVTAEQQLNGKPLTVSIRNGARIDAYSPLELLFSEQVDIQSLEENLTITPRTRFTLEYDKNTVTVYPEEGWIPGGKYTVTIANGYKNQGGRQFADAQSLSFDIVLQPDDIVPPAVVYASDRSYILNEARDMTLAFDGYGLTESVPVVVDIYRIPTIEQFREQGEIYLDYEVPLDHLEKIDSNVYLVEDGENRFTMAHPGLGAYIVAANFRSPRTDEEIQERSAYLVTPYSVYMQASVRDTLVWLNRSGEGAAAGYGLYYGDDPDPVGITDENGVIVTTGDEGVETVMGEHGYTEDVRSFSITDPAGELIYYDMGVTQYGGHEERFYSYLFTARTLYHPEDTVSFWGYVKPFRNN